MAFFLQHAYLPCVGGGRSFGCPRLNVSHWTSSWRCRVLANGVSAFPVSPVVHWRSSREQLEQREKKKTGRAELPPELRDFDLETFHRNLRTKQAQVKLDKKYQTADWRERPLPQDYAWLKRHWWILMLKFFRCFLLSLFRCENADSSAGVQKFLKGDGFLCSRYDLNFGRGQR